MVGTVEGAQAAPGKSRASKLLSILGTIAIAAGILTVKTYFAEVSSHETTIQSILDRDPDYNNLSVAGVGMPAFKWIWLSDMLMQASALPKSYSGTFTVKHKDDKPLPAQCDGHPFGYTMRLGDGGEMRLSIDADTMNGLVPCNA